MIKINSSATMASSPRTICDEIFDVSHWPDFSGYGLIPGIASAKISNYDESKRVGTRFEVLNTDNSRHVETVIDYIPDKVLVLRMDEFSSPLKFFASHFIETWQFEAVDQNTNVERIFELHPCNIIGSLVLRIIAPFLKKAIQIHLDHLIELQKNY